jgi:hypothetical protein
MIRSGKGDWPTTLRPCQEHALRSGNAGKNLVVFYVLLIHGEDFAAIDASEIQQNVHVYKTPRWIFRVAAG